MINIIKTAIITIIISFISGLLLDHYKSVAPRILCSLGRGIPLKLNNKKICAYILNVRNMSNKTIHDINLNVQDSQNNLKTGDSKITKGLKFDASIKDSMLDVYIPFLSKNDEFSVTLYVENQGGVYKKPVVTIRSPENFKKIDCVEKKGLFNIPKNINKAVSKVTKKRKTIASNKKSSRNKKVIITIVSIILVMTMGVLGKAYFQGISNNTQGSNVKVDVPKKSIDAKKSVSGATKNTRKKASTGRIIRKANTKTSIGTKTKKAGTKTSIGRTAKNTSIKTPTKGTTKGTNENTEAKTSTKVDTKESTGAASGTSKDKKISTGGTTEKTDTKASTSKDTDVKASTGATTGNSDN